MVIDTSAIVAVLFGEPESETFCRLIGTAPRCLVSAFSVLETGIVIGARKGEAGLKELDLFWKTAGVDVIPLDDEQQYLGRKAYFKYGKGIHPAGLNIGDCCSYALAKLYGEPLLFKGQDFGLTDVDNAASEK